MPRLPTPLRRALAAVAGLAVLLGALLAGLAGCAALSREGVEARVLALGKNAPVRDLGLSTARIATPAGERELRYLSAPRLRDGEPARRPVVLVHGTPGTLACWSGTIFGGPGFEGLRARRDVHALEVLGHGFAPGDPGPLGFQACADFVAAAVAGLGLSDVHLVGHSYGGELAWRAALDHPELWASLVLVDTSGLARPEDGWLPEEVAMRTNPLADLGWLLNSEERVRTALAPHYRTIPPDRVEELHLVGERPSSWRAMIDLVRDENGARAPELGRLALPTLLLWGAEDVAYPPAVYGERFARAIPGARLETVPGAGHYPHEERPAAFVAALERFLDEVEAR